MPEWPKIVWEVSIGQVLTVLFIIGATCKSMRSIQNGFRKAIQELHEGIMADEERRIEAGETTTLRRIIERVLQYSSGRSYWRDDV